MINITKEFLNDIFEYRDGNLYTKKPQLRSRMKIGDKCGSFPKNHKYGSININRKTYLLHRIIFLYHYGYIPEYIDHINGNSFDNIIEKLRPCTLIENQQNRKKSSINKTGFKGIRQRKSNLFEASIRINKKRHFYCFKTLEEANDFLIKIRKKNHKLFAKNN